MAGFNGQILLANNINVAGSQSASGDFNANGQLLIGGVAAPNMAVGLPTASNGVQLNLGQNSLDVAGITATDSQIGVVELADNAETIAGTATDRANTPASLGAKLGAQTANAIAVGAGTAAALAWAGPLTDGQVLLGSTGVAPVGGTIGTSNGVTSTSGAGTFAIAGVTATDSVIGVVELADNAETIAGAATDRANTPASLAAKLGTQTQFAVPYGGGAAAAVNWLAPLTDGQLVIGSTGVAPVAATLTAGAGTTITNAAGSITIASTSSHDNWSFISASQALVANNSYVCIAPGGALSLSLPATAAQGTMLNVSLDGATSFAITQGAGQQIRFGNLTTTAGAGGSLSSAAQGDSVTLVCTVADTNWLVVAAVGNLSVV